MTKAEEIAEINAEIAEIKVAVKNILKNGQALQWGDGKSRENVQLQTLYTRLEYLQKQLKKYKIKKRVLY